MKVSDVIKDADETRAENFQSTPPIDVYGIATNNGLDVVERHFPPEQANIAGFVTLQNGRGKLYVNLSDSPNRRRFTVAHELGHWRLHKTELEKNPNRSILFRIAIGQLNKDPIERDANVYAANLLVPLETLKEYRDNRTKEQLAELFEVSTEVMGYRLSLLEKDPDVAKKEEHGQ
jgi:Zn-dependent peptidase ImmA (M78 family)